MFRQLSWLEALIQKPWARGRSWGPNVLLGIVEKDRFWKSLIKTNQVEVSQLNVGWAKRQNTTKTLCCWSCADGISSLQVSQCRGEMNFARHTMAPNKFVLQSFATAIIWTTSFLNFKLNIGFRALHLITNIFIEYRFWAKGVAWLPPIIIQLYFLSFLPALSKLCLPLVFIISAWL